MANGAFDTNLLKMIAAELYFSVGMTVAREMYGKSYFALGVLEKAAVDQAVFAGVGANFQNITPELLKGATLDSKVGFQAQPSAAQQP
jgi:hypothetical protein